MRHFGLKDAEQARRPEMGSVVGRLMATGEITVPQARAAHRWAATSRRAMRAVGVQRTRDSCDFSPRGRSLVSDEAQAKADKRALEDYRAARHAILDPTNPLAHQALQTIAEDDRFSQRLLGDFRIACNALIRHWPDLGGDDEAPYGGTAGKQRSLGELALAEGERREGEKSS